MIESEISKELNIPSEYTQQKLDVLYDLGPSIATDDSIYMVKLRDGTEKLFKQQLDAEKFIREQGENVVYVGYIKTKMISFEHRLDTLDQL